ncbi:MAG: CsbD family protein [Crocosphaera sp.]|nr:CsbD family protein [Crocosphaera sp.]
MKIQPMLSKFYRLLATLLLISSAFLATLNYSSPSAYAVDSSVMIAVDEALGSGTIDKIKGKAQQDLGTVQKNVSNDVEDEIQGTVKQIKGRAKQDIGKTKSGLKEAGSNLEEASENVVDSVKNFFGS